MEKLSLNLNKANSQVAHEFWNKVKSFIFDMISKTIYKK